MKNDPLTRHFILRQLFHKPFVSSLRGRQDALETIFDTRPPVEELKGRLKEVVVKCQRDIRKQNEEYQNSMNKVTRLESERNLLM